MKTRIAYSDYTVKSVAYETDDLIDLAEFLEQQAPTLKDAEQFVTACATDLRDDDCVDQLGDAAGRRPQGHRPLRSGVGHGDTRDSHSDGMG